MRICGAENDIWQHFKLKCFLKFLRITFQNFIKSIGQPNTNLFSSKNKVLETTEVDNLLKMTLRFVYFFMFFEQKTTIWNLDLSRLSASGASETLFFEENRFVLGWPVIFMSFWKVIFENFKINLHCQISFSAPHIFQILSNLLISRYSLSEMHS